MEYKTIVGFVQSVIDSIQNTSIASVKELKRFASKNIFSVKVTNPQKKVEVTGLVKVSNQKDLDPQLKNIALSVRELKKPLKSLKEVKVSNFPKQVVPKTIKVSNLQKEMKVTGTGKLINAVVDVRGEIKKLKLNPQIKVDSPTINVPAPIVNVPKAERPVVNVEAPTVNVEKPDMKELNKIVKYFNSLNAKNPLAVRLSNGKSFYTALEKMADIYAGSTFSAFQYNGQDARALLNSNGELQVATTETWFLNDVQVVSDITYLGEETVDGRWRIKKIEEIGDYTPFRAATIRNNPSASGYSYDQAWESYDSLDYGRASEAL